MLQRPIPKTGELLPAMGLGTYRVFDRHLSVGVASRLTGVLEALIAGGGTLIDSSPMYGKAESVAGELIETMGVRDKLFIATKVWISGAQAGTAQMEASLRHFRTDRIELMQIHNLVDWETQLKTCRAWRERGVFKYLGITHYTTSAFGELAAVLAREDDIDFLQIPYNIAQREAEDMLLPLAEEKGVAVLPNIPLGQGSLMRRLGRIDLPGWLTELGCQSWAQMCLKYLLGHPAVTSIIPATADPDHMRENVAAAIGHIPTAAERQRMAEFIDGL
jgi:aryl-alcohol dehydrogenase-like predicted oxidoreductase